ncbi:MAG1430 family protein [Mycoplasma sp. OR1901]|uniref:MAG1430 family protein n=1 Tax=Mycoplasma sp. OR1901 TaxID=2742195 RepID=UPI0015822377|nr:hypothetical protein [Mycoplasma sp. OR1901]QKT05259.1 hypothetical protein HTZ87_00880 [Mycoplasma sp. OR1901]
MSKKLKVIFGAFVIGASIAGITGALVASKSNQISEKEQLHSFNFGTFNSEIKKSYASAYASNPVIKTTNNVDANNEYWKKLFKVKKIPTSAELEKKDFYLLGKRGELINIFDKKYNVYFNSYANDLEGKLFLVVSLYLKNTSPAKLYDKVVLEVDGFKTMNFENIKNYVGFSNESSIEINESSLNKYDDFESLKTEYKNIENNIQKKEEFIRSLFNGLDTNKASKIDFEKTNLEFKDQNIVVLKTSLKARINLAQKDALLKIDSPSDTSFENIDLSDKEFTISKFN